MYSRQCLFSSVGFFGKIQGDGRLLDLHLEAPIQLQPQGFSLYAVDTAMDTSDRHHVITFFNFRNKVFSLFLLFLLGSNHEEVHDQDDTSEKENLPKNTAAGSTGL